MLDRRDFMTSRPANHDDVDCHTCNDTGTVARRTSYPMTIVGPGPVPDDAKGVVEDRCPDCDPVARWTQEFEGDD